MFIQVFHAQPKAQKQDGRENGVAPHSNRLSRGWKDRGIATDSRIQNLRQGTFAIKLSNNRDIAREGKKDKRILIFPNPPDFLPVDLGLPLIQSPLAPEKASSGFI